MPDIDINGIRIHYTDEGSGSETVVFSHSYLVDHRHFEKQIAELGNHYRILAYDHRGHGQSSKPTDGYSMQTITEDGIAFLEAMNCGPCHWVGLSTGGFVGMRIAIHRPELLRSLVLMDTAAEAEPRFNYLKYSAMFWVLRYLGFGPIIGSTMKAMFGPRFIRDKARSAERQMWHQRIVDNDVPSLIGFGKAIFTRSDVTSRLAEIRVPTLVIVGERDTATPVIRSRRLVQGIPSARLEIIPHAGHLCTIEEPDRVNQVLSAFLGISSVALEP